MKHNSPIIITILLSLFSCSERRIPIVSDIEENHLNGKIKSIEYVEYAKPNEKRIAKYDEYGFIYHSEFWINDTLDYSEEIVRDSTHRIIKINTIFRDEIYETMSYNYEDQLLNKIEQIVDSEVHSSWIYERDEEGRKTKQLILNNKSDQRKITYSYPNKETEITKIYNEKEVVFQEIETKSEKGGSISKTTITTYFSPQISSQYQIIIEVDSANNVIKKTEDGTEAPKQEFTYMYEFDSLNNWKVQYIYLNESFQGLNERTIQYY